MKRITLLFLALSSLTLAAVTVNYGDNFTSNQEDSTSTSSININVTASVSDFETTQLKIVDADGKEITSLDFHHNLDSDRNNKLSGEMNLTQDIYAIAHGLTQDRIGKITQEAPTKFELKNTSSQNSFETTFNSEKANTIDIVRGLKFTLTSTVPAETEATGGSYTGSSQQLTLTYNKQ
ncbi:MAG: hypothetical protein ACRCYA_09405 [Cetobacterium sp.]|uniref:hypothetical protein n=1 Tax=Cetobacterium sp. TaxID=2071632 RepID=UPI003F30C2C6